MVLAADALANRTVLLTGASGSIGSATATTLGAAGATVIAQYRSRPEGLIRALSGVPSDRQHLLAGELGNPDTARRIWRDAESLHPVDVLVLNAAAIPQSPMDGSDAEWDAGWEEAMRVNVVGAGALMREAVRSFADRGGGTIVAVSSWAAEQGSRILDVSAYAASKAALRNLAQTLARNYARNGVHVHVVAPGVVEGGMGTAGQDDATVRAVADGLAMGRRVAVQEVAELISFLASGAAPSLTGGTVDLNGASYIR
ncbi:MAG: SDR family NAD(P)-dependent oxidoreductase [Nakamurella sp.]